MSNKEENNQFDVPFQVQTLLEALRDRNERVHIRGNYRMRLDGIRRVIEKAITDYDVEMGTSQPSKVRKRRR